MAVDRDTWFKFFPSDWRGDEGLQMCSLAARGLWTELLCVAHKEHGYVLINGRVPKVEEVAKLVRSTADEVANLMQELILYGVCESQDGVIHSRRMVRDAKVRKANKRNGKRGGNPTLLRGRLSGGLTDGLTEDQRSGVKAQIQKPDTRSQKDPTTAVVIGTYPTRGGRIWNLTQAQVNDWRETYPKVDVPGECKKAKAWLLADGQRLKTRQGMPRFLVGWLNRATNDAPSRLTVASRSLPAPEPVMDFDLEEECKRTCKTRCETAYVHAMRKPVAS
jgi:hypothetical protein